MKRYTGKTRPKFKKQPADYAPPPSKLRPRPQSPPTPLPSPAKTPAVVPSAPPRKPQAARPAPAAWDPVAQSYDTLVGQEGSDYHRRVVFPGVLKMLALRGGERVLDLACGQGAFCRVLAEHGAKVVGVDASPKLIDLARRRGGQALEYHVADARNLAAANVPTVAAESFDLATCVLAIQDIDPLDGIFLSASWALRPGGKLAVVMTHPSFRGPKATDWGWDPKLGIQYRRVDAYLRPRREKIITHPGRGDDRFTWSFHRPLETYVKALAAAGLLIDDLEEWPSHKRSDHGPRAAAEDAARGEIPLFLALRAVKTPAPAPAPS